MSDKAAAAKKAFGTRLRDLRKDAGLTGRQLSAETGIHNTKVSRIEHGQQSPTEDDIREWCIACGVARLIPELIAVHREIEQMWVEWKRELRAGQKHIQSRAMPLYEKTKLLRAYESIVVPGILQTHAYVLALFEAVALLYDLPESDPQDAADARLARQHLITAGTGLNRYAFVVEYGALNVIMGDTDVMLEQLDFLTTVTALPHVSLGIIPPERPRTLYPGEGFYIFDEQLVRSPMWSGGLRTNRPEEVAFFLKTFTLLRDQAVFGVAARHLIEQARWDLQTR